MNELYKAEVTWPLHFDLNCKTMELLVHGRLGTTLSDACAKNKVGKLEMVLILTLQSCWINNYFVN